MEAPFFVESNLGRTKSKAKKTLEDDEKSAIYARRKIEVESVFGHIKGNRSFRHFSLRGLGKIHMEFGIVALAHNLLKVAGLRLAALLQKQVHKKDGRKTLRFFAHPFYFGDLLDSPFVYLKCYCWCSIGGSTKNVR
ncbi:transposase [Paenibacillus qinlingensis]|uniref:transposase n=1 Tax=Paenibacillus qinlingensis TaxID=1837343 RepID=UPI001565A63D|nr:transposase [Paenibacillus qinlingensis]